MKKLTDDELMTALAICSQTEPDCKNCPVEGGEVHEQVWCSCQLMNQARAKITRLQERVQERTEDWKRSTMMLFRKETNYAPGKLPFSQPAKQSEIACAFFARSLAQQIMEHPGWPVIPIVDGEVANDEAYTSFYAGIGRSWTDRLCVWGDEFFDDPEYLNEQVRESLTGEDLTDAEFEEKVAEIVNGVHWHDVIFVNVGAPDFLLPE